MDYHDFDNSMNIPIFAVRMMDGVLRGRESPILLFIK